MRNDIGELRILEKIAEMDNQQAIKFQLNVEALTNNRGGDYNEVHTYIGFFGLIPSRIHLDRVDCSKMKSWLEDEMKHQIAQKISISRVVNPETEEIEEDDLIYLLPDKILLSLDTKRNQFRVLFPELQKSRAKYFQSKAQSFKHQDEQKTYIHLIGRTYNDVNTQSLEIKAPLTNLSDNYNDDFLPVHENILKRLKAKNDKGIVLLHGKPGTGKTSYIRHLIREVQKEVIFLPPSMAGALTEPGMISILTDNPNSIFVIEDAERVLVGRESDRHSPVSTLLNISDGLLADCLNIQIICSFNTDLSQIDRALLRKGRLIAKYEFKELALSKAQKLSKKLGFEHKIVRPMSLSEIYHPNEPDFAIGKSQVIGYKTD